MSKFAAAAVLPTAATAALARCAATLLGRGYRCDVVFGVAAVGVVTMMALVRTLLSSPIFAAGSHSTDSAITGPVTAVGEQFPVDL